MGGGALRLGCNLHEKTPAPLARVSFCKARHFPKEAPRYSTVSLPIGILTRSWHVFLSARRVTSQKKPRTIERYCFL